MLDGALLPGTSAATALPETRLRQWLLRKAQLVGGAEHGAVIGSFGCDGLPRYAYPEIAGYYLSWLSWLHREGLAPADARARMNQVLTWLQGWQHARRPTRRCLGTASTDWRNQGRFSFDLAMLLGGLAALRRCGLLPSTELATERPCGNLIHAITEDLLKLVDSDGMLAAARSLQGELPTRWSIGAGAFQTKPAAILLLADRQLALPPALIAAARATLRRALQQSAKNLHPDNPHAALYCLEGLLIAAWLNEWNRSELNEVKLRVDRYLADLRPLLESWSHGGHSPESEPEVRHDVFAQWLRLSRIRGRGVTQFLPIATHLRTLIGPDGALPFAPYPRDQGANTWAALFADQALQFDRPLSAEQLF